VTCGSFTVCRTILPTKMDKHTYAAWRAGLRLLRTSSSSPYLILLDSSSFIRRLLRAAKGKAGRRRQAGGNNGFCILPSGFLRRRTFQTLANWFERGDTLSWEVKTEGGMLPAGKQKEKTNIERQTRACAAGGQAARISGSRIKRYLFALCFNASWHSCSSCSNNRAHTHTARAAYAVRC